MQLCDNGSLLLYDVCCKVVQISSWHIREDVPVSRHQQREAASHGVELQTTLPSAIVWQLLEVEFAAAMTH
jgi:hypothetical protein